MHESTESIFLEFNNTEDIVFQIKNDTFGVFWVYMISFCFYTHENKKSSSIFIEKSFKITCLGTEREGAVLIPGKIGFLWVCPE